MTKWEHARRLEQELCHLGYIWEEPFGGCHVYGWRRITTRLGFKATLAEIWQRIRIISVRLFGIDIKIIIKKEDAIKKNQFFYIKEA